MAEESIRETGADYRQLIADVSRWLEQARQGSVRAVNMIMTVTYGQIGQRLVEQEQRGASRAAYGEELIARLAQDLTARFGRGFSRSNLFQMRQFYLTYQDRFPASTSDANLDILQTLSGQSVEGAAFPLSWSHYVRLLTIDEEAARRYYETEALRGGWSVREMDRQIATQAYQRLRRSISAPPVDATAAELEIRDPFVLEFLDLRDEYSESDLEQALILELEQFLLELGNDFAFVARQKRLRVGTSWYRVDLVFFHRRLRCLVIAELKVGKFTHADAGQMNLYLNYAREHWTLPDENPPVGLILCSEHDAAVAHYALGNLTNQVMAREYKLALPEEKELTRRLEHTRKRFAD